jgi:hypothetical protein
MLSFLLSSAFALEFTVTNDNVGQLIAKSHETPVFLLIYSSSCGHCQRIYPVWRKFSEIFSKATTIIIAELDVVTHRKASTAIVSARGYPSWCEIVNGNATLVPMAHSFDAFVSHAQALARKHARDNCSSYLPGIHPYPAYVFAVPNGSCDTVQRICSDVGLSRESCYSAGDSKFGHVMSVVMSESVRVTVNATKVEEIHDFLTELTRPIVGDWNIAEARASLKKKLVVVYSTRSQVRNLTTAVKALMGTFLIRKVSEVRYRHSQIGLVLPIKETPAFLIADTVDGPFQLAWQGPLTTNFTDALENKSKPLAFVEWDSVFEKPALFDWFWPIFVLSSAFLLILVFWLSRPSPTK